jgi:hypothetical protein
MQTNIQRYPDFASSRITNFFLGYTQTIQTSQFFFSPESKSFWGQAPLFSAIKARAQAA